ncbi:hypothetical protein C8R41DRAFT_868391 [Lentinula lateritia]|uniref:Transcription factor IIIC subunit Tfc1/Sfc1 triple barrel domain-containing protein n=1 Tax=Lentinula lateritia TaxID=40482 RepID=A0ABQ8VCX6_9AGAR|nr:hypothetical protein C8R41DRAFT_868391 [Lentinula lateritia]
MNVPLRRSSAHKHWPNLPSPNSSPFSKEDEFFDVTPTTLSKPGPSANDTPRALREAYRARSSLADRDRGQIRELKSDGGSSKRQRRGGSLEKEKRDGKIQEWKKARERNRGAERPDTDDALSASVTPRVSFIYGGGSGYEPDFSSDFSLGLYPEVSSQVLVETVPQAICNLGGPSNLETAFRRGASKSETLVELKLPPDDSFVHPVPGEVVANDVSLSNFKGNPASIVSTVVNEETGEKRRMINRMRWKGYGPATIAFSDPTAPDKPPTNVGAVREQVDKNILRILRDVWGVDHFRELAGDVLNFGLAKEASGSYPVYANSVHLLTVADDVAVPRSRLTLFGRPGLVDLGPTVSSENR